METRGVKRNSRNKLLKAIKDKQLACETWAIYLVTSQALNLYCFQYPLSSLALQRYPNNKYKTSGQQLKLDIS